MKKAILLIAILLTTLNVSAQFGGQNGRQNRRGNQLGRQQPNTPPSESQIEAREKRQAEAQEEFIVSFIKTLEGDDFIKEIAKITIDDYFEKSKDFMKIQFNNTVERKEAFEGFKREHFKELRTLISEVDAGKLNEFLDGNFKEKPSKKEKKKKRKRKNDDKN